MATAKSPAQQASPLIQNNTGRIKYAEPRSLPSFPSSGLAPDGAAASAAASLGWSNQKSVDIWKPDPSSSASAAAVLAKEYKMSPLWEPSAHSDGHKAALLAVGSAEAALKKSDLPANNVVSNAKPGRLSQDTWGNSAAKQAFHANRTPANRPLSLASGGHAATQAFNINRSQSMRKAERSNTPPSDKSDTPTKALMAAKGAMRRPASAIGIADIQASERNAAASALNGATSAHRQSMQAAKPGLTDVGAVSVTTMTRNMFTANPPVKPEVDEQTYNERIHQSAVEMAKKMYARQQIMVEKTKGAQAAEAEASQPNQYVNLQEAAYRQAQARLAKLHDEQHQSREYQEYYGKEKASTRNRHSMMSMLRRKASDSDDSIDDRQQTQNIHEQMSMFSSKLSQVDKEKREKDREALLAAAQRNVKARLHGMDEKIYQETGRTNPSLITDWEAKAQKAAQTRHDSRTENKGKIDIGGGMFMTQEEIDAIASNRIQPVLDDIDHKAETERERQEILKLEEQARREEAEKQKSRERETKEIVKKTKEQDKQEGKAKKMQEKLELKHRKDEEKRLAKEEKRKSKLGSAAAATAAPASPTSPISPTSPREDDGENTSSREEDSHGDNQAVPATSREPWSERSTIDTNIVASRSSQHEGEGGRSPTAKVKGWIKHTFAREKPSGEQNTKRRSFFGGASLKSKETKDTGVNDHAVSIGNRSSSVYDVAPAGKAGDERLGEEEAHAASALKTGSTSALQHEEDMDSQGVSPVSSPFEEERELGDTPHDGEDRLSPDSIIEPPRRIHDPSARTSSSPNRDSRFREELK
ncbi:hypothetical protein E4U17_005279 [Claviceps sp. LM77 group G4]|nr:hypothetical protein E4U17_005279 [Claviceps sp. LM77 group G4]KAG6081875.1 hypothetical protein E4U16_006861 [Claviceps sp. LM84 group G4]KAG6083163.1 hypothetical protein E4U33_004994 [Claviceps sp. LM78 group G4]